MVVDIYNIYLNPSFIQIILSAKTVKFCLSDCGYQTVLWIMDCKIVDRKDNLDYTNSICLPNDPKALKTRKYQ